MSTTIHLHVRCSKGTMLRRGAVAPLVAVSSFVLLAMAGLAIDSGVMYNARTELQASADAAALAGARALLDDNRLKNTVTHTATDFTVARQQAAAFAARNLVMGARPTVDLNPANSPNGDVVCGRLSNPLDLHEQLSFHTTDPYNTVRVRVHRDNIRNGPVSLFFGPALGVSSVKVGAEAAAYIEEGIVGVRIPSQSTVTSPVLPFGLKKSAWDQLVSGTLSHGDRYCYDSGTDNITTTPDGIHELNIYPGSATGSTQLGSGNFGTLSIGADNNSTETLSRQILDGLSAEDLSHYGGAFQLGEDGTIPVEGNTGLSAGMADALEDIIGQPRILPLFSTYQGTGSGAVFTVVGFAGVRIMHVKLTGSMSQKQVIIQPSFVVDGTIIPGPTTETTSYCYKTPRLVR